MGYVTLVTQGLPGRAERHVPVQQITRPAGETHHVETRHADVGQQTRLAA
jgi:hypothetical protein